MKMITVTACLALAACSTRPLGGGNGAGGDGGSSVPAYGAYRLTVTPTSDDCSPALITPASALVAVFTRPTVDAIGVSVPNPRFDSSTLPSQEIVTLNPDSLAVDSSVCGAGQSATFTLAGRDANGFSLAQTEDWTNVVSATPNCQQPLPTSDCSYRATLRYDLEVPCEQGCTLAFVSVAGSSGATSASCNCPN